MMKVFAGFYPKQMPQDAGASFQLYNSLKMYYLKTKNTFQAGYANHGKCFKMREMVIKNERVKSPIPPTFGIR